MHAETGSVVVGTVPLAHGLTALLIGHDEEAAAKALLARKLGAQEVDR